MALISRDGSLDWLCWPRFDSPSIFAAILDQENGGAWSINPSLSHRAVRTYIENTNVLETTFSNQQGTATLTDLMPVASEQFKKQNLLPEHEIIRQVTCSVGEVQFQIDFVPRADYGSEPIRLRCVPNFGIHFETRYGAYWLRSSIPLQVEKDRARGTIVLKKGEVAQFSLTYAEESPSVLPCMGESMDRAIERSVQWWKAWAARSQYQGPYRSAVTRSALALKALTYAPSGAVAAAATTSLPERPGDTLNWDYRYCWLRDASLTIRAMVGLGYLDESESFLTWLLHSTRLSRPELRILYTVYGQMAPAERELKQLCGYLNSRPVRVGNEAKNQLQMDVYGEVVEAAAQYSEHMGRLDRVTQKVLIGFGKYVAEHWDRPDEGIWEPRSGRQNHTHSRLMCWTALDRLLAMNEKGKLKGVPREFFQRERDRIRRQLETRAWNPYLQSYVSTLGGDKVDATLLRIPWYGLEAADSQRMKATYERVLNELSPGDGLLYRYVRDPQEGAFGICGFWGVEFLALSGRLQEAHKVFERLLNYGNDVGLFAEEIDPATGDALGNFPQAFTHIGLISAALTLQEREQGEMHPSAKVGADVQGSMPVSAAFPRKTGSRL